MKFDAVVQGFASRLVRQSAPALTVLGVVHTHPGSLRHPSSGDYAGDSLWVRNLRGREGLFGIGTADGSDAEAGPHAETANRLAAADLRLSWYLLGEHDRRYRSAEVEVIDGPDSAAEWRPAWPMIERHAARLERLATLLNGLRFGVEGPDLWAELPARGVGLFAGRMTADGVRYHVGEGRTETAFAEDRIDRGLLVLLGELMPDEASLGPG